MRAGGAPIASLWPLAERLAALEALGEADPKAALDIGVDIALLRQTRSASAL